MQINYHSDVDACWIEIQPLDVPTVREGPLNGDIVAGVDEVGALVYLDVHGGAKESYGLPDEAAAEQLVAWAREQLAERSAT
jgi:hypothetical protein